MRKRRQDKDWAMEIASRIRDLRSKKGKRSPEVAEAIGISRGGYLNWELGNATPPWDMLVRLAEYFDTTVDFILSGRYIGMSEYGTAKAEWSKCGCAVEEKDSGEVSLTLRFPVQVEAIGSCLVRRREVEKPMVQGESRLMFHDRKHFIDFTNRILKKVRNYQLAEALCEANDKN